jgi:hypothetical protein
MIWPLKHTVAPKEAALSCVDCHAPDGRLSTANLASFYMPGRDRSATLDVIGILLIAGAIVLAFAHGLLRVIFARRTA